MSLGQAYIIMNWLTSAKKRVKKRKSLSDSESFPMEVPVHREREPIHSKHLGKVAPMSIGRASTTSAQPIKKISSDG
jgi:hypothetical protein